jgi:hypothetical protein
LVRQGGGEAGGERRGPEFLATGLAVDPARGDAPELHGARVHHHLHPGPPHQGRPDSATEVPAVPPVAVASRASSPASGVTNAAATRTPDLAPPGAVEQLSRSIRVPRSILGTIVHKTLRQAKMLRANPQLTETDVTCRCRRGGNDTGVPQSRPSATDRARRGTGSRTSGGATPPGDIPISRKPGYSPDRDGGRSGVPVPAASWPLSSSVGGLSGRVHTWQVALGCLVPPLRVRRCGVRPPRFDELRDVIRIDESPTRREQRAG